MNTLVAGILVSLIIAIAGFGCGHRVGREGAELKASNEMSEHMLEDENLRVDQQMRALAATDLLTAEIDNAAQAAYKRGMEDAEVKRSTVIADLRSGKQRLRDEWSCKAAPAANVPGVAGPATEPIDTTADREEGAGDLVRAAAQCDAQAEGLIAAYTAAKTRIDEFNKQGVGSSRR